MKEAATIHFERHYRLEVPTSECSGPQIGPLFDALRALLDAGVSRDAALRADGPVAGVYRVVEPAADEGTS